MSVQGREFILVGTAHVSQESTDLVREVLGKEKPDCVCVEIDAQRYMALSQQQHWEDLDVRAVIRQRHLGTLIVNLVLASYHSILKFFQVDITGMFRMTSSARYFKAGVGSSRPN